MDVHIFEGLADIPKIGIMTVFNIILANIVTMADIDLILAIVLKCVTIISIICTSVYTVYKLIKLLKSK